MTRSPPAPKDPRVDELVGIARDLARVAGFEAAEARMLHFGGQRIYVPEKMRPKSEIWKALGPAAAKALAAIVAARPGGVSPIDVPLGGQLRAARRKEAIRAFNGSKNKAAAAFQCSRRTVQRYRNREPASMPLFDPPSKRS